MNKTILICATNTGVGKTTATLMLLKKIKSMNMDVCGFKPVETGVSDIPEDASLLLKESSLDKLLIDDICPIKLKLPAAPYVANDYNDIDFEKVLQSFNKLKDCCNIVIIESAGGLFTPLGKNFFNIDLYKKLNCDKLLLICDSRLGCISNAIVYAESLKNRDIPFIMCVNRRENDNFEELSLKYWLEYFGECFELERDLEKIINELIS